MNKNIKYSQNFLTSEKVLNQIIKQLNLKETDTVYEIGTEVIVPMLCFHASALTFTSMQPTGQSFAHFPQPTQRSFCTTT